MGFEFAIMKTLFIARVVLVFATSLPCSSSYRFPEAHKHAGESLTTSDVKWKDIPVLCYHNIRMDTKPGEYTISAERFKQHMKLLADSGYHAIRHNDSSNGI